MNKKIIVIFLIILATFSLAFQGQQYARRFLPIFTTPATPCVEGSIYYHMLEHRAKICTNNGVENFAVGAVAGIPTANATTTGVISNTDWLLFNTKQNALGFTPENIINKNASNGYVGLSGGKINASVATEILSILDLLEYSATSGTGVTAIRSTISSAATNDVISWNGINWVNQSQLITSVFGRAGTIIPQSGDYSANQVTNAFDINTSNNLTNIAVPPNPIAGRLVVWADSVDTILKSKNSSGVVAITVIPNTCSGTDKVSSINSSGIVVCTPDQTGGGGGGGNLTSLNGLTTSDQTLSATDDTNVDLVITSTGTDHNFDINWSGLLAKARMVATVVNTDQANAFGAFTQTFQAGSLFKLTDPTNTTKVVQYDLSNISSATTRTVNIPDANSTTVQSSTAPSNNFANAISSQGVISYAQPTFSNLSGSATDAQIPDSLTITTLPNLTVNGFVKTSSGNGTIVIDSSTYLTGNQTITLSGNVTGSGTTSITTTIANNVVTGAMIAVGSDVQGDILFYNGTDWTRLGAGTTGQVLQTNGTGANPSWVTIGAGAGDMILASVQTVTGAKTFDPAKLIIGGVASDPSVVVGAFYRDTDDRKLYWGVDDTVDFWGEVFVSGLSLVNLATNVTGIVGEANGGTGNSSWDYVTLTDGATITWTVSGIVNNATVTLGGNRNLAFSGLTNGQSGTLIVKQDGTGNRTLTLPASSKVINGGTGTITLSTPANSIDILTYTYDGTNIYWTFGKNYN